MQFRLLSSLLISISLTLASCSGLPGLSDGTGELNESTGRSTNPQQNGETSARITGTVFQDSNGNGQMDDSEAGLEEVRVTAQQQDDTTATTSEAEGTYQLEVNPGEIQLDVNMDTLPSPDPGFAWEISAGEDILERSINVSSGITISNQNFGFRQIPMPNAGSSSGEDSGDGDTSKVHPDSNNAPQADPELFPEAFSKIPTEGSTIIVPREGPWQVSNHEGTLQCDGMNIPMEPVTDSGTIEVLDDGDRLRMTGIAQTETLIATANWSIRGRYNSTAQVATPSGEISMDFFFQLVTAEYIVGYLLGETAAEGVTCVAYRSFELLYIGE